MDCDLHPMWDGAVITIDHWHIHRRLLQRYGIVLGPGEFSRIVRAIRKGHALRIEDRQPGVAVYSVRISSVGERVYVLTKGEHLITVLPPSSRLNAERRRILAQSGDPLLREGG